MFRNDLAGVTAAVLAGGLGTRLRAVVADRPKVLAPVAGRPFLAHLLDQLAEAGVRETVLLVGHMAELVREEFGDWYREMRLAYSHESDPLGTGGAVRLALPHFHRESVLLLNGDSYCRADYPALMAFHRQTQGSASLVLTRVPNASRFGRVVVGAGGRVERFEEKDPTPTPGWINAGVYLLGREVIAGIEPGARPLAGTRPVAGVGRGGPGVRLPSRRAVHRHRRPGVVRGSGGLLRTPECRSG